MPLLDRLVAWQTSRRKLFRNGLGDRELLRWALLPVDVGSLAPISLEWGPLLDQPRGVRFQGTFPSPLSTRLPARTRDAIVELVAPSADLQRHPVCLHLAAGGEQGVERRRRLLAAPLLSKGIASLILENPYYGARRPATQIGAALETVADLALMGRATVSEAAALVGWLHGLGVQRIAVAGISMGGQMAALAASCCDLPVAAVPCIPSRTPAEVFTECLLARAVDWKALQRDLGEDARADLRAELMRADVLAAPPPRRPDAAVLVAARHDGFVGSRSAEEIHRHWPGSELRVLPTGHVGAVLFHLAEIRRAMSDALNRL